MDAAAAGGTRPQWNTTQPPKGAGHRHSAARGAEAPGHPVREARATPPSVRSRQRGASTEAGAGLTAAGRGRWRMGGTADGCGAPWRGGHVLE